MPLFNDLSIEDRQHPLTTRVRQELGVGEFARLLAQDSRTVHQAAVEAFQAGNRDLHDRLLHIGWLINHFDRRRPL